MEINTRLFQNTSEEEAAKIMMFLDALPSAPLIVHYPSAEAYQFDPLIDAAITGCTHFQLGVIQITPKEEESKNENVLDAMSGVPPLYQSPIGELYQVDPKVDTVFSEFIQLRGISENEKKKYNKWKKGRNCPDLVSKQFHEDYEITGETLKTLYPGKPVSPEIISLVVGYFTQLFALGKNHIKTFVFPGDFIDDMVDDLHDPTKMTTTLLMKHQKCLGKIIYLSMIILSYSTIGLTGII